MDSYEQFSLVPAQMKTDRRKKGSARISRNTMSEKVLKKSLTFFYSVAEVAEQGPKKREFWVRAREECEAEKGCAIIYCRKLSSNNIPITYIIFSLKKRQHNIRPFLIPMTKKYMNFY
jgi:hypothetical protein